MQYKQWLNEWLELYVKASTKELTYRKYRQQAEKYLMPALGEEDMEALTPARLQALSVSLAGRGLSPNTANNVLSVLKASLRKAVSLGVAARHFADTVARPRARCGKKVTCFTAAEQKKIERYILERRRNSHLFGILLALYTGLRIGELLALTWEDIDFRKGTLSVTKTCHDGWREGSYVKTFDTTKTESSERVIPLPKQLLGHLRDLRRATKGKFVVIGKSEYGAQVRSYQRSFQNLLRRLHIPHRGFHSLRHTFATRALEVGMDVRTLSEILGHQNPTVTLQRYAHSLIEHKTEMMNRIGRLLP